MAESLVSLLAEQLGSITIRELEQKVKLHSDLTIIQAVSAYAETGQVREATVRDWLEKLTDVAYDIEDVLDDWEAAILRSQSKPADEQDQKPERKVCSFLWSSCFCCKRVVWRHDVANKIKELNKRFDLLAQQKDGYKFVPTGADPPIERLMTISMIGITELNMLVSEPRVDDRPDILVISIVGMEGIGKTTLFKFAFNVPV